MDQRRSDIGQDVKDIVQTRNAISQKLEMLEHRFHETVEETKTSVEDMVDRVKDAADDIVVRTKQTFDPTYHVDQRPWAWRGATWSATYRNHGISVKTSVLYVSSRRLFTHPRAIDSVPNEFMGGCRQRDLQ